MTPSVPLDAIEQIAQGVDHAEGICMTLDGTVYLSGERGQIYRLEADDSATEVACTEGWTLGLAADAAGRIYACDPVHRAVMRWEPGSDKAVAWCTGVPGRTFQNPNWGAFAPDGAFFVSDSGNWKSRDGCILVVRRGQTMLWTDESCDFPNGLAVSPDAREVWVLESTPGRLVAFDIQPSGRAGPRRVVLDMPSTVPDGIAFAADGSVLITCYRPDAIYRWVPGGTLEAVAADPEGTVLAAPTNCAFVGERLDQIVVPNIGRWHASRFVVPGLTGAPLHYPDAEAIAS